MEIEAKFRVEDAAEFARLLAIDRLGPYELEAVAAGPEFQQNVYFDTEDGRVRRSQHALRVRTVGEKRIVSFKGATRVVGAVHERAEWEVEIGDEPSPRSWPPSEAREHALALVGNEPLLPIVRIQTSRRSIRASLAGLLVAEISLDEGTISAGGLSVDFREVEVESAPEARRSEFDALVHRLEHHHQLVREHASKFARGLKLLEELS